MLICGIAINLAINTDDKEAEHKQLNYSDQQLKIIWTPMRPDGECQFSTGTKYPKITPSSKYRMWDQQKQKKSFEASEELK